jgi:hypothetical protein
MGTNLARHVSASPSDRHRMVDPRLPKRTLFPLPFSVMSVHDLQEQPDDETI